MFFFNVDIQKYGNAKQDKFRFMKTIASPFSYCVGNSNMEKITIKEALADNNGFG
jgi:hypothetical protein